MPERALPEERLAQAPPLVLRCIDFRTNAGNTLWLAKKGFAEGSYHVYASAGAAGNPQGFLDEVRKHNPSTIKVLDHEDCGFYKANGFYENGDAPHEAHHHNLQMLGLMLHENNPQINYRYNLLRLNKKQRERHTCEAVAIVLGEPEIVKIARQTMAELGLSQNYDKIARPYELSPDDQTIWTDLEISLRLHQPNQLYIFERSREKAQILARSAREVSPKLEISPVTIQRLSPTNQLVTIYK